MSKTIKVFTTTNCTRCTTTKRWLTNRGIEFEAIDVTDQPELIDSIRQIAADKQIAPIMPLIEVHDSMEAEPVSWFDFRVDLLARYITA